MKKTANSIQTGDKSPEMLTALKKLERNMKDTLKRVEQKLDNLDVHANLKGKDFLITIEACRYLGCTRVMLWRMVANGRLKQYTLGNKKKCYAVNELKALAVEDVKPKKRNQIEENTNENEANNILK